MSSSADEVVNTTTGMWLRSGSDLDLLEQLAAVVFRQVQVEQHQVGPRRILKGTAPIQEVQAFLAVVRDMEGVLDLVVLERFPGDQLVPGIILDQ